MTRSKAFLIHLCISALAAGLILFLVRVFWYPYPYFEVTGVGSVLRILVCVYLILGPVLTLILFKPGKAGLKFDMYLVAIIQSAALIYGSYTLYLERPYYIVFVKDRFEVLAQQDMDEGQIKDPSLFTKSWTLPVLIVATMPADIQEQQRILEETLLEGKPDIHQRPEYWSAYAEQADQVNKGVRTLSDLLERRPDGAEAIYKVAGESNADDVNRLIFAPIMGKQRVFSLVLDPLSLLPIAIIDVDPWGKPGMGDS